MNTLGIQGDEVISPDEKKGAELTINETAYPKQAEADFFAQDPLAQETPAQMIEIIESHESLNWLCLIDSVFDHDADDTNKTCYKDSYNCYANSWLASGESVAPRLIVLPKVERNARHKVTSNQAMTRQLMFWLSHCNARPMFSLIGTKKTPEELMEQWAFLYTLKTEEGKKYLLRFADTRILPHLPALLFTPEQWAAWARGIEVWMYIDREGRLQVLPKAEDVRHEHFITVTNEAYQKLRDINEVDSYLTMLWARYPIIFDKKTRRTQYFAWANEALAKARAAKVGDYTDKLMLITKTIDTQGRLLAVPECVSFLMKKSWEEGQFINALHEQPWYQKFCEETEKEP